MTLPANLYAYTDQSANPETVYTDSTTLVVGQILYDDEGADSGLTIGTINQDGSFNLSQTYYGYYTNLLGPSSYYLFSNTATPTANSPVYVIDINTGTTTLKQDAHFIDATHVYYSSDATNVSVTNCSDCLHYTDSDTDWNINAIVNFGLYNFHTANESNPLALYTNDAVSDHSNLVISYGSGSYKMHKSIRSLKFSVTDYDSTFTLFDNTNCTLSGTNNRILTPVDYSQLVSIEGDVED